MVLLGNIATFTTCILWLLNLSSLTVAQEQTFFSSTALLELEWSTVDVDTLHLHEINDLESTVAVLLQDIMNEESEAKTGLLSEQKILSVDLHVNNVTKVDSTFHLEATTQVLYLGHTPISDLASVLIRLSRRENAEETLLNDLFEIIGGGALSLSINYKTLKPPATVLYELEEHSISNGGPDKSLILACTLLCGALVLVTTVLLYVAGGWRDLKDKMDEQMDWFKDNNRGTYTQDEEDGGVDVADSQSYGDDSADEMATNPSGIIGIPSQESGNAAEGLGIGTPERGLNDEEYGTPFSETSNYSDTNRAPLGITSMRKMVHQGMNRDANVQKMMPMPPLNYR